MYLDGAIVAGTASDAQDRDNDAGFVYDGTFRDLGFGFRRIGGVSSDGSTLFGYGASVTSRDAWVWRRGEGLQPMKTVCEPCNGILDASFDASVVVGMGFPSPAWYWDEVEGHKLINEAMRDKGVPLDLSIYDPSSVAYVSDDATVFVSDGIEGAAFWWAHIPAIPEPSTLSLLAIGLLALRRMTKLAVN